MPWAKLSDDIYDHPKIVELQNMDSHKAIALWALGMSYCMRQLTDGAITATVVRKLGYGKREIRDLITVGLWDEVSNSEWQYHDWLDYQKSRADVLSERKSAAERKRRERRRHGGSHGVTGGVTHNGSHGPPDQTRPEIEILSSERRVDLEANRNGN